MNDTKIYEEYSKYVTNNKKQIEMSKQCTCIQCKETFFSEAVILFIYSNSTGVCPFCESDLLIPDCFDIQNKKISIEKWNKYIIGTSEEQIENTSEHINKKRKT